MLDMNTRIVLHTTTPTEPSDLLWTGFLRRVPSAGERITIPTREGPRTYKVARVTTDVNLALWTVAVVKVKDHYED